MISPTIDLFLQQSYERAIDILRITITNQDVLWILAPLVATLILMELYFGRYKQEELGWNTAFGNALVLIFISANLINHLIQNNLWANPLKSGIVIGLLLVGFLLTVIDFFHWLPEDWAFTISSKFPISFLALLAILFVYGNIPTDYITLGALIMIFIASYLTITILHYLIPTFKGLLPQEVPDPIE